jgi:hypothetical protein
VTVERRDRVELDTALDQPRDVASVGVLDVRRVLEHRRAEVAGFCCDLAMSNGAPV